MKLPLMQQLLNGKQIAAAMNRKEAYVLAMKDAGYVMAYGNQDTLANALAWRRANPGFRSTAYRWRGTGDARKRKVQ